MDGINCGWRFGAGCVVDSHSEGVKKMPTVYILHIAEDSDDEVSMGIGNVFST